MMPERSPLGPGGVGPGGVGLGGVGKNLLILDLLRKLVPPPSLRVAMGELEEEEIVGQVVLVNTINMMKTMTFL